jgi:hypothetical protein
MYRFTKNPEINNLVRLSHYSGKPAFCGLLLWSSKNQLTFIQDITSIVNNATGKLLNVQQKINGPLVLLSCVCLPIVSAAAFIVFARHNTWLF